MKRVDLIEAIESFGCHLVRHGGRHDWSAPHRQPARVVQLRCSSARQEEDPLGPAAEASGADSGQGKGDPTPPRARQTSRSPEDAVIGLLDSSSLS